MNGLGSLSQGRLHYLLRGGMYKNKEYRGVYQYSKKIKNKISRMRRSGLNREGIYSPENLAFKMLRNSGYLEKVSSLKIKSYDNMMSLNL